jgi:3-hydroxyacyl-CoA dehydrogenase/enoyl-CoA hydratase/3-hydroxybutyryl-CoA epimerase
MTVPGILGKLGAAGSLGRKTGKGFYVHEKNGEPVVNRDAAPPTTAPISRDELARRMALLMVNEAALCLQEGIAETAGDVDFAMVMGTGFAPFRGGPLRHADTVGVGNVVDDLSRLAGTVGPHYQPCPLLADMAQNAKRFYED